MDPEADDDPFAALAEAGGDEFMAIKPWCGTLKNLVPSSGPKPISSPPDASLTLEYVHGYRSQVKLTYPTYLFACSFTANIPTTNAQDSRQNLYYSEGGDLLYPAAALGVVMSPGASGPGSQKFMFAHTDDVLCLTVDSAGRYAATGEVGKTPKICVWDTASAQMEATLKGFHKRGVSLLAFSADGQKLASVGLDDDHSVAV